MKLRKSGVARLAAMVCVVGFSSVTSARVQAQTVTIGSVEEGKLGVGFKKYKDAMDVFEKQTQSVDDQLHAREFLDADEGRRFDTLAQKDARSGGDETAFQALVATGKDRRAKYMLNLGVEKSAPAELAFRKKMEAQAAANQTQLRAISDAMVSKLKKTNDDINKRYADQIKAAVAQVATEKKLTIVVAAEAVVWQAPTTDITDDVLARLNK